MSKRWFNAQRAVGGATEGPRVAVVNIFAQIGGGFFSDDGVTAKSFVDAVNELGDLDEIEMHINSPGGEVFDGLAIYNYLRRHPAKVTAYVDGVAASIASVIAMAGDKIIMPSNAQIMVHDPWSFAIGNSTEMRKSADTLDRVKSGLLAVYQERTGKSDDEISALMTAETWISAEQAVELGFADEIEEPIRAAASFDMDEVRAMAQAAAQARIDAQAAAPQATDPAPQNLGPGGLFPLAPDQPQPEAYGPDAIARACLDAGMGGLIPQCIDQRMNREAVARLIGNASRVRDICAAARIPNVADVLITNMGDPAAMLQAALAEHAAVLDDSTTINSRLSPGAQRQQAEDHSEMWAAVYNSIPKRF